MRKFNTKLSKNGSSVHISLMSRNICIPIVAVFFLYLSLVFFAHHWSRSLGRLLVSLSLSWFYSLSCSLPDGMRCLESLNSVDASKMHWCILTSQSLINFTTIFTDVWISYQLTKRWTSFWRLMNCFSGCYWNMLMTLSLMSWFLIHLPGVTFLKSVRLRKTSAWPQSERIL